MANRLAVSISRRTVVSLVGKHLNYDEALYSMAHGCVADYVTEEWAWRAALALRDMDRL